MEETNSGVIQEKLALKSQKNETRKGSLQNKKKVWNFSHFGFWLPPMSVKFHIVIEIVKKI